MKCDDIRDSLSALLDHELMSTEKQSVETHLERCPACAEVLSALRDLAGSLQAIPRPAAPEGLAAAVRGALRRGAQPGEWVKDPGPADRETESEPVVRPIHSSVWRLSWVRGVAAAAVLVVGLSFYFMNGALLPGGTNEDGGTGLVARAPQADRQDGDRNDVGIVQLAPVVPRIDGAVQVEGEPAGLQTDRGRSTGGFERILFDAASGAGRSGVVANQLRWPDSPSEVEVVWITCDRPAPISNLAYGLGLAELEPLDRDAQGALTRAVPFEISGSLYVACERMRRGQIEEVMDLVRATDSIFTRACAPVEREKLGMIATLEFDPASQAESGLIEVVVVVEVR